MNILVFQHSDHGHAGRLAGTLGGRGIKLDVRRADLVGQDAARGVPASLDGIDVGEPDPDYEASDAKRDVATLLDKLPEKQRTAIRMVKLEEKSVKETSEATGLSESDVKISIHRGLKTLMRLMGEEQTT